MEKGVEGDAHIEYERSAEFGNADVRMIPLDVIINLKQVRQSVDHEELNKLKDRIVLDSENGVSRFNLVHPITINLLDRQHAEEYLQTHSEYYQQEDTFNLDKSPTIDGLYAFRVSGHMRGEAALAHCSERGIKTENATISAVIKYNQSFIEANRTQNIENTRVGLSPADDAQSISYYYQFRKNRGEDYSVSHLSDYFGYSKDKIRDALRFVTAPEHIKDFVGHGFSYVNVVDLVKLQEAYLDSEKIKTDSNDSDENYDKSWLSTIDFFERTLQKRLYGTGRGDASKIIKAKIAEVRQTAEYLMEDAELFFYDVELAKTEERKKVRKENVDLSVSTAEYYLGHENLDASSLERIRRLGELASKRLVEIEQSKTSDLF